MCSDKAYLCMVECSHIHNLLHTTCLRLHLTRVVVMLFGETAGTLLAYNTAREGAGDIHIANSGLLAKGLTLKSGTSPTGGSVLAVETSSVVLTMTTILEGLSVEKSGGGIVAMDTSTVKMFDSEVVGCQSVAGGGGIALWNDASLVMHNTSLRNNLAGQSSLVALGRGRAMAISADTSSTSYGEGGAVRAAEGSRVRIIASIFQNNSASDGGALSVHDQASAEVIQGKSCCTGSLRCTCCQGTSSTLLQIV